MKIVARMILLLLAVSLLAGCAPQAPATDIAATTLPVYEFTRLLTEGTGLSVTRLVTENVSCLHDYALSVRQVKALEAAQVVVISGGGLEHIVKQLGSGGTNDPLNQRATVGWKATKSAVRLVEGYMVRIETTSSFSSSDF